MAILNRKMFNKGGQVSSRGVGITSGLATPKRGYVDGPGSYAGEKTQADFFKENQQLLSSIYQPQEEQSRLRAASPALLALGSALLSGRSFQGGVGGALEILGGATAQATPFFDDMIKQRRAEKNATRSEQLTMDMKALEFARSDKAAYDEKMKPFTLFDDTLRFNPANNQYDIIASKPSELMEVTNAETGDKDFISEDLVRADMEAFQANPNTYSRKYLAEKKVTDIEEAYDNKLFKFTYVSKEALESEIAKQTADPEYKPRYSPKGPDNSFREVFSTEENKNIFISESAFNTAMADNSGLYLPPKDGLDTFKEVHSQSLGANIFVTQADISNDAQKDIRDFSSPKDDPTYSTYYDPILKANVLASKDEVTARIKDDIPNNNFEPKQADYKDTLTTLWSKKDQQNILVSQNYALANTELFEPEHKNNPTKAAIDVQNNNKLVFVTNKEIAENPTRYSPAILGQNLTVDKEGKVTLKSELMGGAGTGLEATTKQLDSYFILENANLMATNLVKSVEDAPSWAFGVSGSIVEFSNKYLTQLGVPFSETASTIRGDIRELGQSVLKTISGESRFTDADRLYINQITGQAALEGAQSYEEVLNRVQQVQILLEERLAEAAGAAGVMPSYKMSVNDLYDAYTNFRIDNNYSNLPESAVRRSDVPSLNFAQFQRRLRTYHYDKYIQYYNPDGTSKKKDN